MSGRSERRTPAGARDAAGAILSFAVEVLVVVALAALAFLVAAVVLWLV